MIIIPLFLAFYAWGGAHAQPEWGPPPPPSVGHSWRRGKPQEPDPVQLIEGVR